MIAKRSIPLVNYILERIGYGTVEQAQVPEEIKKKDSPSRQSFEDAKVRSTEPDVTKSGGKTTQERESVLLRLEANRKYLESHPFERKDPTRGRDIKPKRGQSR